ncbi:hypothetical protein MVEN_00008100 [Mycena venus]|uniref:Uncharacterized protein n=1 Tax=Mycena venus TaxID=2733690 RepID=A0A8H7DGN2_9AGAR|nr:hypothetical protein MVEN_00008100 [Mycena venus]
MTTSTCTSARPTLSVAHPTICYAARPTLRLPPYATLRRLPRASPTPLTACTPPYALLLPYVSRPTRPALRSALARSTLLRLRLLRSTSLALPSAPRLALRSAPALCRLTDTDRPPLALCPRPRVPHAPACSTALSFTATSSLFTASTLSPARPPLSIARFGAHAAPFARSSTPPPRSSMLPPSSLPLRVRPPAVLNAAAVPHPRRHAHRTRAHTRPAAALCPALRPCPPVPHAPACSTALSLTATSSPFTASTPPPARPPPSIARLSPCHPPSARSSTPPLRSSTPPPSSLPLRARPLPVLNAAAVPMPHPRHHQAHRTRAHTCPAAALI